MPRFMIIDLPPQQPVIAWHQIVDVCLQNSNLLSDVRVSSDSVNIAEPPSIFNSSINTSSKYVNIETTLDNVEESLEVYFANAVNELADQAGITDPQSAFAKKAQSSLKALIKQVENDKSPLTKSTSEIIQQVDRDALKALFFLKAEYAQSAPTSSSDPKETNNFSNITPLPQTLILSGGGMKGVGYVGAYKAMEESGILSQIKLVAGSSVGASTAAFIAAGMSPEMMKKISDDTDYEKLLTGHSNNQSLDDTINFTNEGIYDGTYAMDQVNENIAQSITHFFKNISLDDLQTQISSLKENGSLTDAQETLLLQLKNNLLASASSPPTNTDTSTAQETLEATTTTPLITFQDLDALHQLNPSQFKSLTVTGFDETQGKEIYFNVQNNPFMVIAQAVRISMSLPGLFEPIKNDQGDILEDGSIGSNTPSEVSKDPSTTLVCYFNPQGEAGALTTWVEEELSGNTNLEKDEQQDLQKIAAAGSNAFAIYYGILGTTSFTASLQNIHAAELQAEVRAWEQLLVRQN